MRLLLAVIGCGTALVGLQGAYHAGRQVTAKNLESRAGIAGYVCTVQKKEIEGSKQTLHTVKVWSDGATLFRMEEPEQNYTMVYIVNGKDAWIMATDAKAGYHDNTAINPPAEQRRRDITGGPAAWRRLGAVRRGSKPINGVICDVYRRQEAGMTTTAFFPKGSPLPARIHTLGQGSIGSIHFRVDSTLNFPRWQKVAPLDAGLFRPPVGYVIRDAGERRRGMRKR